mgnify:FL=1
MSIDLHKALKIRAVNEWRLFWLISIPMSMVILVKMMSTDLSSAPGVSEMISFSVRWAVPFIYLVVAASAIQVLYTGPVPLWLRRNRKYLGLCFAVAMAWQGLFIFMMSNFYRAYYFEEIYFFRDELEGSTGYIFLAAMVLTTFQFARKRLSPAQWRLAHLSGMYFLWAYPFSVYWWNLHYYAQPRPIDYVFYWAGFLAFALRIAAWGKKYQQTALQDVSVTRLPKACTTLGAITIALGLLIAGSGRQWQALVTALLTGPDWSANLELWLPFWPFEPFLSLGIIGLGVMLIAKSRAQILPVVGN